MIGRTGWDVASGFTWGYEGPTDGYGAVLLFHAQRARPGRTFLYGGSPKRLRIKRGTHQ